MSLSLPKRLTVVLHLGVFLFTVTAGSLLAQSTTPKTTPPDPYFKYATSSAGVSQNQPDAQYLPTPDGAEPGADRQLPNGDTEVKPTVGPLLIIGGLVVAGAVGYYIKEKYGDCGKDVLCYMQAGVESVERALLEQVSGCGTIDQPKGYQECNQKYQALLNGGTIADVQNPGAMFIVADVADRGLNLPLPVQTETYLATINPLHNTGVVKAQAVEELNDSGLAKIWTGIRNTAFALSAVVLVFVGFAIMFRNRIDPRTSITAMNSLPKVVLALVLIYFSFAISGLMLDLGRIALQLVYRTIPLAGGSVYSGLFQMAIVILLAAGAATSTIPGGFVIGVAILLIFLILAILILVVLLGVLVQMVKRYAAFIVYTIFAPLFFLWGAMPGQSFTGWFRSQLANILAIPAMFIIIRLASYIAINSFTIINNDNRIVLPSPFDFGVGIAGTGTSTVATELAWTLMAPLISLGMLFYATKMPAILDGVLGIKDFGARAGFGPGILVAPWQKGGLLDQGRQVTGAASRFNVPGARSAFRLISKLKGPCLPSDTLIQTPGGDVLIRDLKPGMLVWSVDRFGKKFAAELLDVSRNLVPQTHKLLALELKDGRKVRATPEHPAANGKRLKDLRLSETYDGSEVKSYELIPYKEGFTYDILPLGSTGYYWANDVLIGSTLKESLQPSGKALIREKA